MKKLIISAILFLAALTQSSFAMVKTTKTDYSGVTPEVKSYVENHTASQIASDLVNTWAKNIPQRLDYLTTLSSVNSTGNVANQTILVSKKEFHKKYPNKDIKFLDSKKFQNSFLKLINKNAVSRLCSNPVTKLILDKGVEYDYELYFKDSMKFIGTIAVTKDDCK